jgi:hypothetical protein
LYLTHLQGDPAMFIEIAPLIKHPGHPTSTTLYFDPIDFLSSSTNACQRQLTWHLEILPGKRESTDMAKMIGVFFSGWTKPSVSYPFTISFRWNNEKLEERLILSWIAKDKRFETKPQ